MTHLSAGQIAEWMAGERPAEAELHVAGCAQCHAQVAAFEDVLAQFRGSAKSLPSPPPVLRRRRPVFWPRLVAVASALLLLLVPVYREGAARRRALLLQQDAQLLQQ